MTTSEQKTIDALFKLVSDIRAENTVFKTEISVLVQSMNKKVDEKREPLNLEMEVFRTLETSMQEAFKKVMIDTYNSPLKKYAENIMAKYQTEIESVFNDIVSEGIKTPEFKDSVRHTFLNKLAKTVVSGIDGSVDKTVNLMKQDQVFRSKLTLAVNNLVTEFLKP